ncbi:hypothetical protein OO012_03140 [Rhodobacteraceae bacterium KMM 6894]|nr:hypothetical protein [Rhodobacteraceae bacterium KMM 6894]
MNANRIISMVINMVMRRLMRTGVNAGMNAVGKRMSGGGEAGPSPDSKQSTKRAKDTIRMARRIGRM